MWESEQSYPIQISGNLQRCTAIQIGYVPHMIVGRRDKVMDEVATMEPRPASVERVYVLDVDTATRIFAELKAIRKSIDKIEERSSSTIWSKVKRAIKRLFGRIKGGSNARAD